MKISLTWLNSAVILLLIGVLQQLSAAQEELAPIKAEITKRHDEAVKRLQDWIAQVSIAAENRGIRRVRSTWRSSRAMRGFKTRR
jgi:hypothetical protein